MLPADLAPVLDDLAHLQRNIRGEIGITDARLFQVAPGEAPEGLRVAVIPKPRRRRIGFIAAMLDFFSQFPNLRQVRQIAQASLMKLVYRVPDQLRELLEEYRVLVPLHLYGTRQIVRDGISDRGIA